MIQNILTENLQEEIRTNLTESFKYDEYENCKNLADAFAFTIVLCFGVIIFLLFYFLRRLEYI